MSLPETCWSMLCARWRWLEEDTVCSAVTWSEEFLFNVTGGLLLWSELEESILFRNNCHMEWLTFCVEKRSLNYLFFSSTASFALDVTQIATTKRHHTVLLSWHFVWIQRFLHAMVAPWSLFDTSLYFLLYVTKLCSISHWH